MNETINNILKRRSIRSFTDEKIEKSILEEIIKAGRYAPSALNEQPWHFTVVTNKEVLDKLNIEAKKAAENHQLEYIRTLAKNEEYHVFHKATAIILVSYLETAYEPKVSCGAATENILLAAESFNLGSCWIGLASLLFKENTIESIENKRKLGIPDGYQIAQGIALGYKEIKEESLPELRENTFNFIE